MTGKPYFAEDYSEEELSISELLFESGLEECIVFTTELENLD